MSADKMPPNVESRIKAALSRERTPLVSKLVDATYAVVALSERVGFDFYACPTQWGIDIGDVSPVQAEALAEVTDGDWRDLAAVRKFHSFGTFHGIQVNITTAECPTCRHCDATAFDSTDEAGPLCIEHARAASSRHDEQEASA